MPAINGLHAMKKGRRRRERGHEKRRGGRKTDAKVKRKQEKWMICSRRKKVNRLC